jgi:outer membrane protein assembly factor BamA/autotransporter translocation and assembly factor TamB
MKRLGLLAAAAVALVVVFVLVVHTPPFRRLVLRYVISEVQRRYALRIDAARLDYNLAALTLGLADVRLAADRTPSAPFFEAAYVAVALPSRVLIGVMAFDDINVTGGRIHLVRDRDGRMNIPESSQTPSGEPAALDLGRLLMPRLLVDYTDAQNDLAVTIPGVTLDIGREQGRVALNAPATIRVGNRETRLTSLDGGASFDGRALKLSSVSARADEASLQVDGTVSLLVRDPSLDVRTAGTADVERVARWGIETGERPRGSVAFDVRAQGPFDDLGADVRASSARIDWQQINLTDVLVQSRVTADGANVETAQFTLAGGRTTAKGQVPFTDADAHLTAAWTGIDAYVLTTALAGPLETAPTGTLSGDLETSGPFAHLGQWAATVRLHAEGGATQRGRISVPGDTRLQLANGRWDIQARHRAGATLPVVLVAGGRLNEDAIANSTLTGRLDIDWTNVPPLVRMLRTVGLVEIEDPLVSAGIVSAAVKLGGRLSAPTVDADVHALDLASMQFNIADVRATASGELATPRLVFRVDAPSAVIADEQLTDVRVGGGLTGDLLTIGALSASQGVNPGRVRLAGTYNLRTQRYDATADVTQWTVAPTPDTPLALQVDAMFSGTGSTEQPHGTGSLRATNISWNGMSAGDLAADVEIDGQAANIRARAPDLNSQLTARVAVRAPYATTADLRGDNMDLEKLIPRSSSPTPVTGRVTVTAHADIPLAEWRTGSARAEVVALDAAAGDLPIRLTEPATVRFAEERVWVDRFEATAGATRISASGALPVFDRTPRPTGGDRPVSGADLSGPPGTDGIALTATGDIGEAARAVVALGLGNVPIKEGSGPLALRARVTGSLEKPIIASDLDVGPGSVALEGLSTATDLRVRAHLENDVVDLREVHAAYEGATLDATGSLPLAVVGVTTATSTSAVASLHATATGLTPAVLRGVLDPTTLEDLAGVVDVTVNLETPSTDVSKAVGDLTLTRLDLQLAGLPVTELTPTRIVVRDGFARIESWNWAGQGATLGVFGQVRLIDRQAAILANGDIDLRVLTPFVRTAGLATAGHLTPKISITGPLDAPRIDGDVALADGEVRLIDPRVVINGLAARASLTRSELQLRELNGAINGGTLTGSGSIAYEAQTGTTAHLAADIRDMALDFPAGLRSDLDAMLQLDVAAPSGEAAPSGRLSGSITVQRGTYREPLAVVGGLLTALRARRVAASGGGPEAPSAFLKQLALDIGVVTNEDIVVDNNYARVQLGGDLNLIGTAAAPALSGRAVLREGGQLFVGRNVYTISRDTPSTIDFVSPTAIEPELNIHLSTRVSGRDIDVVLTGSAESPQVAMTSEDLGQADITALLLTGRTLDQLGTADATFVGTQVIGNFSGEVLGFAGRAVGLDTLRLGGLEQAEGIADLTAVATVVDPTSRLTFGKGLGSNVNITLSQSLRDSEAQTWIVEYLPTRRFDVRLVSDDENLLSSGFRHEFLVGAGTTTTSSAISTDRRSDQHIAEVRISGDLAFPEGRIRSLLKLGPGDTFEFARWQDDRDRVDDFYHRNARLAARITASREIKGDVVNLVYAIDAGPQTTIEVSGVDVDSAVLQELREAWATSILDELLTEDATRIMRILLARRGYVRPAVSARLTSEGNIRTLHIDVQPGERSRETRVRIMMSNEGLAMELDRQVAARGLDALILRDPGAVTRELTEYLRSRGYLRATVKPTPPVLEGDTAVLPVAVDPGPQFVIATVNFEGRRTVAAEEVAKAASIFEETPYDPAVIDAARDRIVGLYRSKGYAAPAVVANAAVRDTEPRVDLTVEITEGSRQTIGDIVVSGNVGVDTDVVTRALRLTIGAPLEPAELLRARTRLFNTGLFRRVDVTTEPINRGSTADPEQPVTIRVALEPWPALRVRYGLQAAQQYSSTSVPAERDIVPGLLADATRRTLFGRAVSVSGSLQYQPRDRQARAFISAPTFLTLPVESQLVLQRQHVEPPGTTLVTDQNSIAWQQQLETAGSLTLTYGYQFNRDHTVNTRIDPITGVPFDISVAVAQLIGSAAWDTRNDPLNSTRGSLYSSNLQWAPERLGSQFRFLKYVGQAYRFQNVRGVVLASAARLGLVGPLGGQELIPSQRFFAGGSRTVRGVDENSLGPRDFFGDPSGGQSMLILNQEARVPVYKWLYGVGFMDAGNVYATIQDLKLNDLVGSVGFGIRLNTPFALLRADYGRVIWGPAPQTGKWYFGIGQAF